ncbi:MAG: DUF2203 family protein [Planctomycetota bacterium]|jgi:hypothetical protein
MPADQVIKKLFTVEEANQRLPLVRAIVQDIVDLNRDIEERRARLNHVRKLRGNSSPGQLYSDELDQQEIDLRTDERRIAAFVLELHELGVEFKDPVRGLVDFPAMMDDRVVYLCWQLGEPEVHFWHELDADFTGRQSLLAESVSGPESLDGDSVA